MTFSFKRLLLILGVSAYVGVYNWVYITWLHPNFEYIGFSFDNPNWNCVAVGVLLSILPSLWMPNVLQRASHLILWVLFLAVYIPSMFVPVYAAYRVWTEQMALLLALFGGLILMSIGSALPLLRLPRLRLSRVVVLPGLWILTSLLLAWVVMVFSGHFRLVSFGEIYQEIRFQGADVAEGTGVGYAVMLLSGCLHPFLLVYGLFHRRPVYFCIGALGQFLLYCTAGLKLILLSVLFLPAFFLAMRGKQANFGLRLTWGLVLVFIVVNTSNFLVDEMHPMHFMISVIVFLRSFGMTGLTTAQYQDFFFENPYTSFSHVKGLNLFIDYPYQSSIGKEVGFFYSSNADYNANAHFWAMDGLAGAGLIGVLVISLVAALVLWILNSASKGLSPVFASMMVCFASCNLSNVSLFTTLFSGGLGLTILLLYAFPRDLCPEEETVSELADDPSRGPEALARGERRISAWRIKGKPYTMGKPLWNSRAPDDLHA